MPLLLLDYHMKHLLPVLVISIVTLLTGCGESDNYSPHIPDPAPTPVPTPEPVTTLIPGGYKEVSPSGVHNIDLTITSTSLEHVKYGTFTLKDVNSKTRRLFAVFISPKKYDASLREFRNAFTSESGDKEYIPQHWTHGAINVEVLDNDKRLKLTFSRIDKDFEDLGFKVGQSIVLGRISKYKDYDALEKLTFHSKDSAYELQLIGNGDGTATLQGHQTILGCTIEGTLATTKKGDAGSYNAKNVKFSGCSNPDNNGKFFAAIYYYEIEGSYKIKLLINPPYVQDAKGKGAIAVELIAN